MSFLNREMKLIWLLQQTAGEVRVRSGVSLTSDPKLDDSHISVMTISQSFLYSGLMASGSAGNGTHLGLRPGMVGLRRDGGQLQ